MNDMPNNVKHYILIRYEDLRDDYENTLNIIKNKFNLEIKYNNLYPIPINNYKDTNKKFIIDNNYPINKVSIYTHHDLNINYEMKLNYIL